MAPTYIKRIIKIYHINNLELRFWNSFHHTFLFYELLFINLAPGPNKQKWAIMLICKLSSSVIRKIQHDMWALKLGSASIYLMAEEAVKSSLNVIYWL